MDGVAIIDKVFNNCAFGLCGSLGRKAMSKLFDVIKQLFGLSVDKPRIFLGSEAV